MSFTLLIAEAKVPDDEHVWVVPVTWSSVWHYTVLVVAVIVDYGLDAVPRILDVVEVPPQVAVFDDGRVVWLKMETFGEL